MEFALQRTIIIIISMYNYQNQQLHICIRSKQLNRPCHEKKLYNEQIVVLATCGEYELKLIRGQLCTKTRVLFLKT